MRLHVIMEMTRDSMAQSKCHRWCASSDDILHGIFQKMILEVVGSNPPDTSGSRSDPIVGSRFNDVPNLLGEPFRDHGSESL